MKKIGRALAGSGQGKDRDGHNGRRGSQGSKNTDGHQSGASAGATGGPQAGTYSSGASRGGHQPQRGGGGSQGTKRGGGSSSSYQDIASDQDVPAHMRPTVASQSRQINVSSTKKDTSAAKKLKGASNVEKTNSPSDAELKRVFGAILNDPGHKGVYNGPSKNDFDYIKGEYRKLKSENEDMRANVESFTKAIETKDAEIDKLNKFLEVKAVEFGELEEKYKLMQQDLKDSLAESTKLNDSANKLATELKDKNGKIAKLSAEISEHETLIKQAEHQNTEVTVEYNKLKDHSVKVQEKIKKYKQHNEKMTKEMDKLKEENKQLSQSRDDEVAKWVDVEQKLAETKLDLAEAQTKVDNKDFCVVEMQDKDAKKVQELATELERIKKEMEDNKEALKEKEIECLQSKNDYQELQDKYVTEVIEYESKIKAAEAKTVDVEKSVNWSQVKAKESEQLQRQLNDTIADLKTKMELLRAEKEKCKSNYEQEHQQCLKLAGEVKKLQETNKLIEGIITSKEETISKLKEAEASKLDLEKKHEDTLLQTKDNTTGMVDRVQELIKEKAILEKQMQDGYKEREDRIAELEEFINDQVTELDKMEAAMKQTVANKDIAEKELNEALDKKQGELTALQIAYEERNKEIHQVKQSPMYDEAESSQVNTQLLKVEEKLAEANKQLLAYQAEIQKLNEILAKQESSSQGDIDHDTLRETTKRLTEEVAFLKQQNLELQEQKESEMLIKINDLTQQVERLQEENENLQSRTTNESHNVSEQEFRSSVEYQLQGHTDQPVQLKRKIDELESKLQCAELAMENERKKCEEKVNELKAGSPYQQSADQDGVDQLLKENEGHKQTQNQLYESFKKIKSRYRQAEEEVSNLKKQYSQLQSEFDKQRIDLSKARKELDDASTFVEKLHENPVLADRDRDTTVMDVDKTAQIELNATIVEMRNNHSLFIKSKDDEIARLKESKGELEKDLDSKEFEIAQLTADKKDLEEKFAQRLRRISTTQPNKFGSAQDTTSLQDCSRQSTHQSSKGEPSQDLLIKLRERDQTIEELSKQVEQLQNQPIKSSDESGVGAPCVEHTRSGGVGDYSNEGNRNADTKSQISELQNQVDTLTKELMEKQNAEKTQLDQLTKELAVERSVIENAKSEMDKLMDQLQQLRREKKILDQQMKDGYKEREDRIAELEEFINDQVTELDKMEAAMKQTVANKQLMEKDYQKITANKQLLEKDHEKLNEHYKNAKNLVEQYEQRLIAQEETISMARQREENASKATSILEQEKEELIQKNQKMSREVARLMSVDIELDKCKIELRKAVEELQTKEFLLNTYKEDFEQERKDRENAHNIKEDEITKARVKMEEFNAECQEKIENVKQSVEIKMNTLKQQVDQLAIERDKFKKDNDRLRAELEKEKKDAQNKFDVYKKKTEQFQLQWKKREEAEDKINTLTEQLKDQQKLNKQLTSTIDVMMRKSKGIEPQIPSNNIASQLSSQQRRMSPHDTPFSSMTTPADTSSNQYHAPSTVSSSDPSLALTNAGMGFHQRPPPSSTSQPSWQRRQEQQYHYKMQQQQQEEHLHLRGQGRGAIRNELLKPQHEATYYPSDYQGQGIKYLPPANLDNYQPKSMQPHTEHNVAGTNAAPMQFPQDDYNHGRSSGPASLDSSITTKPRPPPGYANPSPLNHSPLTGARRPEKPTQYASEGINEEIRYQADKQRRYQEYERFDSDLQLDPYLICPKCKLQFREGQLPEYRHHIDHCHQ